LALFFNRYRQGLIHNGDVNCCRSGTGHVPL